MSHTIWISNDAVTLSLLCRDRIVSNRWLSGREMDACQTLLGRQFQHLVGLKPTYSFDLTPTRHTPRTRRLSCLRRENLSDKSSASDSIRQTQVLHINGDHWVLVTNQHGGPENTVYVYDSRPHNPDNNFSHVVAAVFRFRKWSSFFISYPEMTSQKDGSSCGVYCIAYLTALGCRRSPDLLEFRHEVR